jgi:Site-specific recombinase XerD
MKCPECGSSKIYKAGFRYTRSNGQVQRYLCRECGFRFSEKTNKHSQTNSDRQICALKAKNLDTTTEKKTVAGDLEKQDIKGKLVWFIWEMQKQGYSKDTIKTYTGSLKMLMRKGADLNDPETVKETLARWNCSASYKYNLAAAYTLFLNMQGRKWTPPRCHITRKLPFIPTETEIDQLIACTGRKTSVFLQTLKETAMRCGEASILKWENVDLQRKTIILNETEKHSNPRIFTISDKLVNMLARLPRKNKYVFGTSSKTTRDSVFYKIRKTAARKLGNPRILKIGLHTFRHWKATMLYHETRDMVLVKEFLGHNSLEMTSRYIQIEKALFKNDAPNFIVKATKDTEEMQSLLEVGFEYVCQKDGLMFFRRRK